MASNGSLTTEEVKGKSLTLSWSIQSQSSEKNSTTIAWKLVGSGSQDAQYYVTCGKFKIVINGKIVYEPGTDYYKDVYKGDVIASGTHTIAHNADGSKSFTASIEAAIFYSVVNVTCEDTWTLTTIARSSSITSTSDIILGNSCSVKWTPASSNFKYKIKFSLGDWNYTTDFITPNTTSAYTYTGYTISGTTTANNTTIYAQLPNTTSGTMTAMLYTYNSSGTQIGSASSKTFTVTIPDNVTPTIGTITLDPVDIKTVDGTSRNILVQGKNKITVSVSGCSAGTGSSIKSYTFSGPNISSTTTSTSITSSSVIYNTGTLTYTVTVTDTRGRTKSNTATITCYEYSAPYFESFSAYKANSNGEANENGSYIKCNYSIGFSSANSTNNVTVKIMYKKNSSPSYSSVNSISNSKNTSGSSLLSSIDKSSAYTVYAIITDNYSGSTPSTTINILGESRILNITKDGRGLAVGKMSEKTDADTNGLFECAFDAKFYRNITINEKTLLDWTHPVGSIYQSTDPTHPSSLFGGGTWEELSGRFLIGAGSTYSAGNTGGEETHTLIQDELPKVTGSIYAGSGNRGTEAGGYGAFRDASGVFSTRYDMQYGRPKAGYESSWNTTGDFRYGQAYVDMSFGNNQAHNNMPPYLVVYMWKRIK